MIKLGISPRCMTGSQYISNVINNINVLEDKNHMIISTETGKPFDKIQHACMVEVLEKVGLEETYLHIKKAMYEKHMTIILNGEKHEVIPLMSGLKQGHLLSPIHFNIILKAIAGAIRQEKEIKGKKQGKKSNYPYLHKT